jgi:hypothetical protein
MVSWSWALIVSGARLASVPSIKAGYLVAALDREYEQPPWASPTPATHCLNSAHRASSPSGTVYMVALAPSRTLAP